MKILLWKKHPGDLLGEAIEFVTHGTYSHAGFERANGKIHELYLPHLRERDYAPGEQALIDAFTIRGITPEMEALFEQWFDDMLRVSIGYSITDLFRIELNLPFPDDLQSVCSGYVQKACNVCLARWPELIPLVRVENDTPSPRDLSISNALVLA